MKRIILYIACLLLAVSQPKAEVTASLLTASPGGEIYELDGHTGLRLRDPARGVDMVVNWGVFDFDTPNFVYRFVKGETDYICAAISTDRFIDSYLRQGRSITEQTLDLTPSQAEELFMLASENLLPANRVYRYSYIHDNCATRPLLMIEKAAGRTLIADGEPSGLTFRDEMTANHRLYPWYQFGIDLALGSGLDVNTTTREIAFSPLRLQGLMKKSGIVKETIVHGSPTLVHNPTPWWLSPLAFGWLTMLITALITMRDIRHHRVSRWLDTIEFSLFGLCGCVIAFLVFISSHSATSPNWLLVWLNPVCLLGAILPWIKSAKKWLNYYHFANFAVLIVWLIIWPLTGQHLNAAFLPWIITDLMRSGANIYICRKS